MMRRVLVTGAAGFVGKPSLFALADRGFEIHAVSRQHGENANGVTWHAADLLAQSQVADLIACVRPTHLIHLAWCTDHGTFWRSPDNLRWLAASAELVNQFAAHGGKRIVIAGSCAEYDASGGICREDGSPIRPETLYGASKHALHVAVDAFARTHGLSFAWARLFHLFGPGEQPGRLVPSIICSLLRGEPARCSEGSQLRDYLCADDAGAALAAVLDSTVEGAVNVGSGSPVALRVFARRIAALVGRPELLQVGALDSRCGEPPMLVADIHRLTDEVGWTARADVDRALVRTIEWWAERIPAQAESLG